MERLTRVEFTHLDKVLYPKPGYRKLDVVKYFIQAAPRMLPFLQGRALVVTRFPDGVEGEGFYGKDAPRGTPDWIRRHHAYSEAAKRSLDYIVCDDLDTLLWLANMAALELHIPLSKVESIDEPDMILFDLDPQPPAGFKEAVAVAKILRGTLSSLGVEPYVKTSGKRGLHIVVHVERGYTFEETRNWAHAVGATLAEQTGFVSSEKRRVKPPGTIYIDYPQNGRSRTMACPYTLRAVEGAPASTPLSWSELDSVDPAKLNLETVPQRQDPWKGFWERPQRIKQLL
jgi:bifunctional non-homologous end joining protein LigD